MPEIEQISEEFATITLEEVNQAFHMEIDEFSQDLAVQFERIKTLKYSDRGELEVTDLNKSYLTCCKLLGFKLADNEFWTDAGTFESYHKAQMLINKK